MASVETLTVAPIAPGQKTATIVYTAHTDGTVGNVTLDPHIHGLLGAFLYRVRTWPTSGGTAPDAADVTVSDGNSYDMLEGNGANLIHATLAQACPPYLNGSPALQQMLESWTVAVANQGTSGADFTVAFDFLLP